MLISIGGKYLTVDKPIPCTTVKGQSGGSYVTKWVISGNLDAMGMAADRAMRRFRATNTPSCQ